MPTPACTTEKGQGTAVSDACKTPSPGGPVIVPYPNDALAPTAHPVTKKVLMVGVPALTTASKMEPTQGDQGGSAGGGVVSGKIMGEAHVEGTSKVKLEGKSATALGNPTQHNGRNAPGQMVVPSQNKVMIGETGPVSPAPSDPPAIQPPPPPLPPIIFPDPEPEPPPPPPPPT
jgi:hypothetical protein